MEQILLWNPDVILFAPGSILHTVGSDPTWQEVSAIKNARITKSPSARITGWASRRAYSAISA